MYQDLGIEVVLKMEMVLFLDFSLKHRRLRTMLSSHWQHAMALHVWGRLSSSFHCNLPTLHLLGALPDHITTRGSKPIFTARTAFLSSSTLGIGQALASQATRHGTKYYYL